MLSAPMIVPRRWAMATRVACRSIGLCETIAFVRALLLGVSCGDVEEKDRGESPAQGRRPGLTEATG